MSIKHWVLSRSQCCVECSYQARASQDSSSHSLLHSPAAWAEPTFDTQTRERNLEIVNRLFCLSGGWLPRHRTTDTSAHCTCREPFIRIVPDLLWVLLFIRQRILSIHDCSLQHTLLSYSPLISPCIALSLPLPFSSPLLSPPSPLLCPPLSYSYSHFPLWMIEITWHMPGDNNMHNLQDWLGSAQW